MGRKIKNLLGTARLDFLALLGISGFWMLGLALGRVKRRKDRRI